MKISVIGLGKAGLPLAAVIADAGLQVIGVDIDRKKSELLKKGINPIKEEPHLGDLIKRHIGKNLEVTADAAAAAKESNAHIIIVPLFIGKNNKPHFSPIRNALENVGKGLKRKDIVVLETTVPVATTETFVKEILERNSKLKAGKDFYLAYSPERIMTGYSISRFREFPKLIGGINKESTDKAFELYKRFANPIKVSNSRTAELAKIAEGVYRDVNIALANELFKVAGHYGIDFWEMRSAAKHQYCNILEPGNVGGHCIPVYPWFLINNLDVPLARIARKLNDGMINYYAKKADEIGGRKIGIIGLSYREGVKDWTHSRSKGLINILKKKGYDVYGLDPLYSKEEIENGFNVKFLNDISKMDVIILMNREKRYRSELLKIKSKVVDIKNVLG